MVHFPCVPVINRRPAAFKAVVLLWNKLLIKAPLVSLQKRTNYFYEGSCVFRTAISVLVPDACCNGCCFLRRFCFESSRFETFLCFTAFDPVVCFFFCFEVSDSWLFIIFPSNLPRRCFWAEAAAFWIYAVLEDSCPVSNRFFNLFLCVLVIFFVVIYFLIL